MTGKERIVRQMEGKPVDRVPMMLHCFMAAAAEAGVSMEAYRSSPGLIADVHIRFAEKYGMDGILMDIDTCLEAHAVGVPVDFPKDEPARVTGCLSQNKATLLAALKPEKLLQDPRVEIALEAVRILKEKAGKDLCIRGNCDQMAFSLAMLAYGMQDFMADLLDEDLEEDLTEVIEAAYQVHLGFHKLMKQAGADLTSFGDSSCGPDLISPACYRKFSLPWHKKLRADLKTLEIEAVCHICGNLDAILEDVAEVGFPAVEADYKTDVQRAKGILQGKSTLFGPLDPSGLFFFGTPEEVERETTRILRLFEGKNIVIGAGCALPSGTPEKNIRAFAKAVKAFAL